MIMFSSLKSVVPYLWSCFYDCFSFTNHNINSNIGQARHIAKITWENEGNTTLKFRMWDSELKPFNSLTKFDAFQ